MKASIVMLTFNQLEYTKPCVESIRKNTGETEHELVAIDNGSTDGTVEYLKQEGIDHVANKENLGIAKAWNQGIERSKGDYICIINNDIIASKGWLSSLIEEYEKVPDAGVMGPGTREGLLDYNFEKYSGSYVKKMKGVREKHLSGWCFLVHKDKFREAGVFSEEYKVGYCEDTDFRLRLKQKGWESYVTGAAFVHHFGNITLGKIKKKQTNRFELDSIKKLNEKWNLKEDTYLQRKVKNFKRFLKDLFLKLTRGHTLLEKM